MIHVTVSVARLDILNLCFTVVLQEALKDSYCLISISMAIISIKSSTCDCGSSIVALNYGSTKSALAYIRSHLHFT